MCPILRTGLVILTILIGGSWSRAQAADSVVGNWRLVSWTEEETETEKLVTAFFGDEPVGVLTYTSDGRMSLFLANPKRKPPAAPKATDAEAADLYRTMIAYSGSYSIDGNKVSHKVEFSWNQAWTGTTQQRFFEIKDDHLTITTPPIALSGKQTVNTLVWARIK